MDRVYIDVECSVCGTVCGSRLCDDCKAETEIMFKGLCCDNFNTDQLLYLSARIDGSYLTDYLKE